MRTTLKDTEFYNRFKNELNFVIQRSRDWIKEGKIPVDRITIAKDGIRSNFLKSTILRYTFGESIVDVQKEFQNVISTVDESWVGQWTLKKSNGEPYKQYILTAYDEMLWMLSLGYLLDVPEEDFKKLVKVIDQDKVKDNLFEFIISAKLKDRAPIQEESYHDFFAIPEIFSKLREAVRESDKRKAEKLIHDFLKKDWYKNHKDAGWYNSHKSKHDTYFGYWSFETAAVVKIRGLDDRSFRENQYYPKDLLHIAKDV